MTSTKNETLKLALNDTLSLMKSWQFILFVIIASACQVLMHKEIIPQNIGKYIFQGASFIFMGLFFSSLFKTNFINKLPRYILRAAVLVIVDVLLTQITTLISKILAGDIPENVEKMRSDIILIMGIPYLLFVIKALLLYIPNAFDSKPKSFKEIWWATNGNFIYLTIHILIGIFLIAPYLLIAALPGMIIFGGTKEYAAQRLVVFSVLLTVIFPFFASLIYRMHQFLLQDDKEKTKVP